MASIINASSTGSGGIVQTADASGVLQLASNGTVIVQVNSNNTTFTGSYVGFSTNGYIRTDITNSLALQAGSSTTVGFQVRNSGNSNAMLSMYGPGGYSLALEGATPQSGIGITFPSTQGSSGNANTLDDYEEGTWTPTLTADSNPSSVSYAAQIGRYTKIGNTVTLWVYLSINSYTGGSGSTYISGLPFTCSGDVQGGMSLNWANNGFVSTVAFAAHIPINQSRGYFVYLSGGATAQLPLTQWTNGTQFIATGSYQV